MNYRDADEVLYYFEEEDISKLLFGHSIVEVRGDSLILDDGTELEVVANEG